MNSLLISFFVLAAFLQAGSPAAEERVRFYDHIQPILSTRCFKCHGPEKPKGGLRLDLKASAWKGGDSGEPAVVPGDSAKSELMKRVLSTDEKEKMPAKGEPLSASQIVLLRKWIDQGAPWPDKDDYWAFEPPRRPPVPDVKDKAWIRNPVDAFVLEKLEARRLTPAPQAGKIDLLRRVYADLVGLPPTPEEAGAFLDDASPRAYENLVDRLLADPRYGERWARFWLDLVRYAESDGFENDWVRPHAWRYRDYVIKSFNDDKPYDRFLQEQIAGDELYPGDPEAIVATGYARLSPWDVLCKNEKQRRQDYLNDVTDTTGSVILGLTVGCARCHDHKYDRITQTDYYGLQAFFAATAREEKELSTEGDPSVFRRKVLEAEARLQSLQREKGEMFQGYHTLVLVEKLEGGASEDEVEITDKEVTKIMDDREKKRYEELGREIKKGEVARDLYRPAAEVVLETAAAAPPTHLLKRGDLHSPGPEIEPRFIAALVGEGVPVAVVTPPAGGKGTGRRSALARWLTSPDNPMTARVIVNRLWQRHFGRGLVATPSDFGRNGVGRNRENLSHPELLDWLACELVRNGWRLKPLHKLILMSGVYRQSTTFNRDAAQADPENTLLWRMNRRRLEGEAIRDGVLAASGRLNPARGGPGVYAKISKEVLTDLPTNDYIPNWGEPASEEEGLKRTIYVFQRRTLMLPIVEAFDGADMSHTCPQRAVTTVAPQALALFNSEFSREEARHFAERVVREAGGDRERQVERAHRIALVRPPTPKEKALILSFLEEQADRRLKDKTAGTGEEAQRMALTDFCHVLLNTSEFIYVD